MKYIYKKDEKFWWRQKLWQTNNISYKTHTALKINDILDTRFTQKPLEDFFIDNLIIISMNQYSNKFIVSRYNKSVN